MIGIMCTLLHPVLHPLLHPLLRAPYSLAARRVCQCSSAYQFGFAEDISKATSAATPVHRATVPPGFDPNSTLRSTRHPEFGSCIPYLHTDRFTVGSSAMAAPPGGARRWLPAVLLLALLLALDTAGASNRRPPPPKKTHPTSTSVFAKAGTKQAAGPSARRL
jgi:hypothetical protein